MRWGWLAWQVLVPIFVPVFVSFLVVGAWATGQPNFSSNYSIILDISPWALTFYSLTLIGSTLNIFWDRINSHPILGSATIITAGAVTVYASFMVVWRHDPKFVAGNEVYSVTVILLVVTIILCHWCFVKTDD